MARRTYPRPMILKGPGVRQTGAFFLGSWLEQLRYRSRLIAVANNNSAPRTPNIARLSPRGRTRFSRAAPRAVQGI